MKQAELHDSIIELKNRAWSVWTDAHSIPRQLGVDDFCFIYAGGVKSPVITVIENLSKVEEHLKQYCEDDSFQGVTA